ncbi:MULTISPECIES: hypothetical protein [unclassified Pelagibacterium]|uniref:hypothetical protein n=1 Tax=Pelagibacterium TaxID=1082930 RepID=UPI00281571F4|nr:hypothetical protein [Pelagibacterium sp. H642]WMT91951.1 hypothetical protein NO934_06740 [Pelagibacterium sp. H642]
MPLIGKGIVAIWNDILPEMRDEFFEWHPREHMQERMGVPGFLRGRRYISMGKGEEFFTLYEAAEPELLVSEIYRQRLANPTEWSLKVLPNFRNNLRGVCRISGSAGYGDGGNLLTLRYADGAGKGDAALAELVAALVDRPRITGAHLVVCDRELSSGNRSLQRGRTISLPDRVIMVEASTLEALEALEDELEGKVREHGGSGEQTAAIYRLEYQVMNYRA